MLHAVLPDDVVVTHHDPDVLAGGDGDTIHKLLKSRNDILKESNYIGIAFDISDRKIKWLRERYPKLATDDYVNAEHEFLKKLFEDLI